jgi:hypothetical protein
MRVVAWLLLGLTAIAALLFLSPGSTPKSTWLIVACGLAAVGPFLAMLLSGYLGPLKRRLKLYLLFPAASMGGQSMFLLFVADAIAAEHFGVRRIAFNVNWVALLVGTGAAYLALSALVRHLRGRWEPYPEMVCPLVAFWMAVNLLAVEIWFQSLRGEGVVRWIGFLPNALPHLIMGSLGFWLFTRLSYSTPTSPLHAPDLRTPPPDRGAH